MLPETEEYRAHSYAVIPKVIDLDMARGLATRAVSLLDQASRVDRVWDESQSSPHWACKRSHAIFDAYKVHWLFPELHRLYRSLREMVGNVTGRDIILSPHARSAVSVKVYQDDEQQGWHYDSNGITALLYLTSGYGATYLGAAGRVVPVAGSMLVMAGRKIWHRAGPPGPGNVKVCASFNYYVEGDTRRPDGLDEVIYGSADQASSVQ